MILSKLLDNVKEEWTVIEKVRRLYRDFCKEVRYDERFMFGQNQDRLRQIYYRDIDIDADEDPRIVCNSGCKAFIKLLERLGIDAKTVEKPTPEAINRAIKVPDVAIVFFDEEGKKYYINPIGDIQNCKFDLRTQYFATSINGYDEAQDSVDLSPEELEVIDTKTSAIGRFGYSNYLFEKLSEETKSLNIFKKTLTMMGVDTTNMSREDLYNYKMVYMTRLFKFLDKSAGPAERKKFYKQLFCGSVLDKIDRKNFYCYDFYKEHDDGSVTDRSVLQIKLTDMDVFYVYDEDECCYVNRTQGELEKLIEGFTEVKNREIKFRSNTEPKSREEQK